MKTEENYNGIAYILNQIECSPKELKIVCNDGAIHIDTNTFNFSFIGKFGSMVLNHCIKENVVNDITKKLIVVSAYINLYSKNNGGFCFIAS